MAINLETAFASIVHSAPPRARLETAFATIVHTAPPRARLEAAWVTIVHVGEGTPAAADPGFLPEFLAGFFDEDKFYA